MKQHYLINNNAPRLLLFFAGWGMDEQPFKQYTPNGYDFMLCYDYRTLDFDESSLKRYRSITVIAWSLGVWVATQALHHSSLPITRNIAVNGTPYPIDGSRGIAPHIFESTLQGLSEENLYKFQRRMCATAPAYRTFQAIAPQRAIDELKEELITIRNAFFSEKEEETKTFFWKEAVIGTGDRIFLPQNQRNAWNVTNTLIHETDAAHYDESLFQQLITAVSLHLII